MKSLVARSSASASRTSAMTCLVPADVRRAPLAGVLLRLGWDGTRLRRALRPAALASRSLMPPSQPLGRSRSTVSWADGSPGRRGVPPYSPALRVVVNDTSRVGDAAAVLRQIAWTHGHLAVPAGDVEHIGRLRQPRQPPAQRPHQGLALGKGRA